MKTATQLKANLCKPTRSNINKRDENTKHFTKLTNRYIDIFNTKTAPNYLISQWDVFFIIRKSKPFKAPESNGIQNNILKYISTKAIVEITYIYNTSIKLQYFPIERPESYRHISLIDTMGKILERILFKHLNRLLTQNEPTNIGKAWLSKNRGAELQLARIIEKQQSRTIPTDLRQRHKSTSINKKHLILC